jgi:LysM repeat protein
MKNPTHYANVSDMQDADKSNYYIVSHGDTLSKIANRANVSIREIASLNNISDIDKIFVGQRLKLPKSNPTQNKRYTVSAGDTISKIAATLNVDTSQLLALNPQIKDPNKIFIGQKINVPQTATIQDGKLIKSNETKPVREKK